MTILRIIVALFLGMLLISGSAIAETGIVKRVKCDETYSTADQEKWIRHHNLYGSTQKITAQVIRDGCRPKSSGTFRLTRRTDGSESGGMLARRGRYSDSLTLPLLDDWYAHIQFDPQSVGPVSGTFDYTYTID